MPSQLLIYNLTGFALVLLGLDFLRARRRPSKNRMDFRFSRYSMYDQKPGIYPMVLDPSSYNLAGNQPCPVTFEISTSGYLDPIRPAKIVLCGGSAAFGTGSTSPRTNISGVLKAKHGKDVVNLSIPGYTIGQEVISLLKHLDEIRPETIILFDGANDLALTLPFNYYNQPIDSDPLAFYGELYYKQIVNEFFDSNSTFRFTLQQALLRGKDRSYFLRAAHLAYRGVKRIRGTHRGTVSPSPASRDSKAGLGPDRYLHWLRILEEVCRARKIALIVAFQPYYFHGRRSEDLAGSHFDEVNLVFDEYMLKMYKLLDQRLAAFSGITYLPVFKLFGQMDVNRFIDPVHLDDKGYEAAADELAKAL